MKNLLLVAVIMLMGSMSFSQDLLIMKSAPEIKIKVYIIHEGDYWIEYYIAEDSTKKINRIPVSIIENIEYDENHKNNLILESKIAKLNCSPGDELQRFTKGFYTGVALGFVGSSIAIIGASSGNTDTMKATSIIGSILGLTGFIVELESISHVGKAGIKLNQRGVGITIPLNK